MYGTVSEICIELLKKHENHERMAVITWIVEDVYEMARNTTRPQPMWRTCSRLSGRLTAISCIATASARNL